MKVFLRVSALLVTLAASACSSVYGRASRELPSDETARLDLRILEARETAAAADRLLNDPAASIAGQSWEESVDECRWELDRRVEAVRDAARRLRTPPPDLDSLLSTLDAARADLAAAAPAPGTPSALRARSSLATAVSAASAYMNARPSLPADAGGAAPSSPR